MVQNGFYFLFEQIRVVVPTLKCGVNELQRVLSVCLIDIFRFCRPDEKGKGEAGEGMG
jgi:hypothetical protein